MADAHAPQAGADVGMYMLGPAVGPDQRGTAGTAPAARTALDTVADWLDRHPARLDRVIFNVYADDDRTAYVRALTGGIQPR
ncbi:hypothetical protein [Streptomyces sp. NPDC052036]|uniref:hypothetical protein n=1 Tax=unclassified Streptomyces TaxID=2593676 RepID=UPI0034387A12